MTRDVHPIKATRATGLERLQAFVPRAGRTYAAQRNSDLGPTDRHNVSVLSPYVRHRLITEAEIVEAVLAVHTPSAAEKFIQEVCWRTYWKGWLQLRPQLWTRTLHEIEAVQRSTHEDAALTQQWRAAQVGATGIDCFDAWAKEIVETGYLHNHTRMWFASIWVFTLKLPWQLGADFFMRHLMDGDPASNTLSWRWVSGLQTVGKTYLARPDNIAKYTHDRFHPIGQLALRAEAITEAAELPPVQALKKMSRHRPGTRTILLIGEDDLAPESWPIPLADVAGVIIVSTADLTPGASGVVVTFKQGALSDAAARAQALYDGPVRVISHLDLDNVQQISSVLDEVAARRVTMMEVPVGFTAPIMKALSDDLSAANVDVAILRRPWDELFWPHATQGFFKLKHKIPTVLRELGLDGRPEFAFSDA